MNILIEPDGVLRCVYDEAIDLAVFGPLEIRRGSHVEPDGTGRWWADLAPVSGPKLGPFDLRSEALDANAIGWSGSGSPRSCSHELSRTKCGHASGITDRDVARKLFRPRDVLHGMESFGNDEVHRSRS